MLFARNSAYRCWIIPDRKEIYSLDINNSFRKNEIDCNLSKHVSGIAIQESLEEMSLIHLNPSTIIVTQDVHVG